MYTTTNIVGDCNIYSPVGTRTEWNIKKTDFYNLLLTATYKYKNHPH
jgi:hypothetical protein